MESVEIPIRSRELFGRAGRAGVFLQGPASNLVPRGVLSGHQADARRRANRTGVGIGETQALRGELFHVGCPVVAIELGPPGVKGHGSILPAHVVDEEKDDVGFLVDGEGRSGEYDQESCEEKKGFHGGKCSYRDSSN